MCWQCSRVEILRWGSRSLDKKRRSGHVEWCHVWTALWLCNMSALLQVHVVDASETKQNFKLKPKCNYWFLCFSFSDAYLVVCFSAKISICFFPQLRSTHLFLASVTDAGPQLSLIAGCQSSCEFNCLSTWVCGAPTTKAGLPLQLRRMSKHAGSQPKKWLLCCLLITVYRALNMAHTFVHVWLHFLFFMFSLFKLWT